ncbi:MAG: ATP-binding cassette domain-containing protein [Desulfuromonadia bacterium]
MTPLIEAEHISRDYISGHRFRVKKGVVRAVDDISISLFPEKSVGIVGESGSGKSTLARLITLLERPTAGRILFRGNRTESMSRQELLSFRRSVQMVFQDPASSLDPRQRVVDILSEPLIIHRLSDRRHLLEQVVRLAGQVGLTEGDLSRYPHEFSGGQRQRIGIARALATNPELLVADEPLSALDLSIQAQIINLLNDLKQQRQLTLVVISHDLSAMPHLVDSVVVMYRGMIVESGPTAAVLGSPRHPYTRSLLDSVPTIDPPVERRISPPPSAGDDSPGVWGCPFAPRCPFRKPRCMDVRPTLVSENPPHAVACHYPLSGCVA